MYKNYRLLFLAFMFFGGANSYASTINSRLINDLKIEKCHVKGLKSKVLCGSLLVPESYSKEALKSKTSSKIAINFIVLPAIDNSEEKEPFMFLAGGPGQASTDLAAEINYIFRDVHKTRDVILIDQRGTGKSHPLKCDSFDVGEDGKNIYTTIPEDFDLEDVKKCLASFEGDLRQYNTANSIRDFDAVRAALGHKQVNLYGGSYGTRAALIYMRMFPETIRSVVLDSVAPVEVPIGLFGKSSARSFNLLLENCQKDDACQKAYPDLKTEFLELVTRLEVSAVKQSIMHPKLGTLTEFVISKSKFIGTLRAQLYNMKTMALVPLVIHQAFLGNYSPLAGLVAKNEGQKQIYTGLTFNIVCNEDIPRLLPEDFEQDAINDFGGNDSHLAWQKVCHLWSKYQVEPAFYQPVTANIPTLILSGKLDPVTPPSNGEITAKTLPNSHHIIIEKAAHTVAFGTCVPSIINEFLTTLLTIKAPKKLDESCLEKLSTPSFMTNLNGL